MKWYHGLSDTPPFYVVDRRPRWLRCAMFFFRGLALREPMPDNPDYRCWALGSEITLFLLPPLGIATTIFAAGYLVGRAVTLWN